MNPIVRILCLTALMMIILVKLIPLLKYWIVIDKADKIACILFLICPTTLFLIVLIDWIIPFIEIQ